MVYRLLSEWRVVTSFYQNLLTMSILIPFLMCATYCTLSRGISPYMVGKLLGHSGTQMLAKVYDHTMVDTLRTVLISTQGA